MIFLKDKNNNNIEIKDFDAMISINHNWISYYEISPIISHKNLSFKYKDENDLDKETILEEVKFTSKNKKLVLNDLWDTFTEEQKYYYANEFANDLFLNPIGFITYFDLDDKELYYGDWDKLYIKYIDKSKIQSILELYQSHKNHISKKIIDCEVIINNADKLINMIYNKYLQ